MKISQKREKSMKLLGEWTRKVEMEELGSVNGEFDNSFDSIGSNIQILSGSFSTLKPMLCVKQRSDNADPSNVQQGPSTTNQPSIPKYERISGALKPTSDNEDSSNMKQESSTTNQPPGSYTPKYEPISDIEEEEEIIDDGTESDVTFDYDNYVAVERNSCDQYLKEVVNFITKTQDMVMEKTKKRNRLQKKLKKYNKKVKHIKSSISLLERMIRFGSNIPKLLDEV